MKLSSNAKPIIIFCVCIIFVGAVIALQGYLISDSEVVAEVERQGYTDIIVVDKHIFSVTWSGCSEDDSATYELRATNPVGERVELLACARWPLQGVTIRTE